MPGLQEVEQQHDCEHAGCMKRACECVAPQSPPNGLTMYTKYQDRTGSNAARIDVAVS